MIEIPAPPNEAAERIPPVQDPEGLGKSNKSAERVLRVLSKFIERPESWGVTELSRELRMTKNIVHRALSTLLEERLVARDATGKRYIIGYGPVLLGTGAGTPDIRALCQPFLEHLHALSGESVLLSIIVGRNRVNIDGIEARGPRVTHIQRGRPRPLHITGNARVLLAFLSDDDVASYIRVAGPFDARQEGRIRNEAELWSEIRRIRSLGYALEHSESLTGVPSGTYVSFPVLDASGRPHAAITVGGPAERFTVEKATALVAPMRTIMVELNKQARLSPAAPAFFVETAGS